jgi:hypothetical protein
MKIKLKQGLDYYFDPDSAGLVLLRASIGMVETKWAWNDTNSFEAHLYTSTIFGTWYWFTGWIIRSYRWSVQDIKIILKKICRKA